MQLLKFLTLWGHEIVAPQEPGEYHAPKEGKLTGERNMKIKKGDSRSKSHKGSQSMTRSVTPQNRGEGSGPGKKAEKPLKPPMTKAKAKKF